MGAVVRILFKYTVLEADSEVLLEAGVEREGWFGDYLRGRIHRT